MIVWLASYPRSGNTLVRTLLKTCFDLVSYDAERAMGEGRTDMMESSAGRVGDVEIEGDWATFYARAKASPEIFVVKTHRPPMDDSPCIYVVRDGRAACQSYAKYMRNFHPDAGRTLLQVIVGEDFYGDWSSHYSAWKDRQQGVTLELRFEQLGDASEEDVEKIRAFLGCRPPIRPWANPLAELHERDPRFFGEGTVSWNASPEWNPLIDHIFWLRHGKLMRRLGYADGGEFSLDARLHATVGELLELLDARVRERDEYLKICRERQSVIDSLSRTCEERLRVIQRARRPNLLAKIFSNMRRPS